MLLNDSRFHNYEILKHSTAILTDLIKPTIVGAFHFLSANGMNRNIEQRELNTISNRQLNCQGRVNPLLKFQFSFHHLI